MQLAAKRQRPFRVLAVLWLAAAIACGGDNGGNPAAPTGSPGPSGATLTIDSNGVISPQQVTVSVGQSVTVVNSDNVAHQITSNPHPDHTDCPVINALGSIQPGQTRLTNAFTAARTCGFHDHLNPTSAGLMGTITIQ